MAAAIRNNQKEVVEITQEPRGSFNGSRRERRRSGRERGVY